MGEHRWQMHALPAGMHGDGKDQSRLAKHGVPTIPTHDYKMTRSGALSKAHARRSALRMARGTMPPGRDVDLHDALLWTHKAIPHSERAMPMHVSGGTRVSRGGGKRKRTAARGGDVPRLITLLSTHHSPTTVKRKARVLTMGTVRLSSVWARRGQRRARQRRLVVGWPQAGAEETIEERRRCV